VIKVYEGTLVYCKKSGFNCYKRLEENQGPDLTIARLMAEADSGNHKAQAQLSLAYFTGDRVEIDLGKAVEYLKKASEDYIELNRCFKAARQQNIPGAYYGIAIMWLLGCGVPPSIPQYSVNLQKAAGLNYPRAQVLLGLDYKHDLKGVEQNFHKSEFWLLKAAENGEADAHLHLYHLYARGGELENKENALFHLEKNAALNDGLGQIYYARLFLEGEVLPKDNVKAATWFILAKQHNHWKVTELEGLRIVMTDEEWSEAEVRAGEWMKKFESK
jgi:TPR repeat protein